MKEEENKKEDKEELTEDKTENIVEFPEKEVNKKVDKDVPKEKSKTRRHGERKEFDKAAWKPKTDLGNKVKKGEIKDIDEILDNGIKILEHEIIDSLLPGLETDLLLIGQSKGKFGGGQRRVFRQTQKKTREGNKPRFSTIAVIGNKDGYVGVGYGKSKETVPAREKAIRQAKLNIKKIRRGCGSWECNCGEPHSIPFKTEGKVGSVIIKLLPAPKGTGLCIERECGKIMGLVGIKDIWAKTSGQTKNKINLINACIKALDNLMLTKVKHDYLKKLSIVEGRLSKKNEEENE